MIMRNSQYSLLPELSYYIWHYSEILPGVPEPTSILTRLEQHGAYFLTLYIVCRPFSPALCFLLETLDVLHLSGD